ncbi:uncharacterized protein [Triticum aestivum]|uniref:uncharacterized protein n=1 Tax=Triticum aestivum TaxID=4565 RepID=UPI001D02CA19|nr:uncharacterized protein LOC123106793 [Triticum aestivum]
MDRVLRVQAQPPVHAPSLPSSRSTSSIASLPLAGASPSLASRTSAPPLYLFLLPLSISSLSRISLSLFLPQQGTAITFLRRHCPSLAGSRRQGPVPAAGYPKSRRRCRSPTMAPRPPLKPRAKASSSSPRSAALLYSSPFAARTCATGVVLLAVLPPESTTSSAARPLLPYLSLPLLNLSLSCRSALSLLFWFFSWTGDQAATTMVFLRHGTPAPQPPSPPDAQFRLPPLLRRHPRRRRMQHPAASSPDAGEPSPPPPLPVPDRRRSATRRCHLSSETSRAVPPRLEPLDLVDHSHALVHRLAGPLPRPSLLPHEFGLLQS